MPGKASRINGKKGGRPQGSENSDTKQRREMKNHWLERVSGVADKIFDAQLDLALGHYAEKQTDEGSVKVYKRSPDAKSLHWIMKQIWGKANNLSLPEDNPDQQDDEEQMRSIRWAIDCALPNRSREKEMKSARAHRSPQEATP